MATGSDHTDSDFDVRRPNRLIREKSPYLLQHAYNPVDWYPWGEEALKRAKVEDKPIFLSVGYSSCHWCHVMEKETFEDRDVAAILNENFVSIKVDREERPDVDEIYMKSVMSITGSGGWPLNVFLTPRLEPFYGGTYFPPTSRHGLPGFSALIHNISSAWKSDRKNLEDAAIQMKNALDSIYSAPLADESKLDESVVNDCFDSLASSFDEHYGGFGSSPKFPMPSYILFLLRYHVSRDSKLALRMVERTLEALSSGGIRDQFGGGFHRYSTDRMWFVPHFEKMLYDNALLTIAFLEAYLVTRKIEYSLVAEDILSWVHREMTSVQGGFFSAQDADSPEGEGSYYAWSLEQIEEALSSSAMKRTAVCMYYGITKDGNFEDGRSIPTLANSIPMLTKELNVTAERLESELLSAKKMLLEYRKRRPAPPTDDKILTSWNGLMISALSQAFKVLGKDEYLRSAERAAEFVLSELVEKDQTCTKLLRRYRDGEAKGKGFLEDYAFFANGLIDLYEASFDSKYLIAALTLCESMIRLFWDVDRGGFFQTEENNDLITRPKDSYDGAIPSGNSMAATLCLRLSEFTGREDLRDRGESTIRAFWAEMKRQPTSFTHMLVALSFSFGKPKEIVISGNPKEEDTKAMIAAVRSKFLPYSSTLLADPALENVTKMIEGRLHRQGEKAKAYVCTNFSCRLPVSEKSDLLQALRN